MNLIKQNHQNDNYSRKSLLNLSMLVKTTNYIGIVAKTLVLFLLLFNSKQNISAHTNAPFGVAILTNCYQNVMGSLNGTTHFNLLNTTAGRTLFFTSDNPLDITSFDIYYDNNGTWTFNNNVLMGNTYYLNQNQSHYKIVPIRSTGSIGNNPQPIEIDFVDPMISPQNGDACLTFNTTNFKLNINLDGLCNPPNVKFTLPASAPNRWGIPANWWQELDNGGSLNIPINNDFCNQQLLDQNGNRISPCLTFNVEITLTPCAPGALTCPDFVFNQQVSVCCFCGPSEYHPGE